MTYQATTQFQWTLDVNAERPLKQWMVNRGNGRKKQSVLWYGLLEKQLIRWLMKQQDHAYKRLRVALDREAKKANQKLHDEVALVKNEDLRSKEKLLLEENRHRRTKEELRLEKDEHEKTKQNSLQLIEELRSEHHKALDQLNEDLLCKICYTHQDRWGMLQCGHMVCFSCAESLGKAKDCPWCRKPITGYLLCYPFAS